MAFRVSFFWKQQADLLGGWSESFWNLGTDVGPVETAATNLRTRLNAVHGQQTLCTEIRISDVSQFRDVSILRFTTTPSPPGSVNDSDYPGVGVQLKLKAAGNYIVRQTVRGTEDGDIRDGGRWKPRPATVIRFNALFAELTSAGNGWALRVQNRLIPKKVVSAITNAGVITVAGHGYATNDFVRITRAKGTYDVNHVWQIVVLDSNSFSLIGWVAPTDPAVYKGNGKAILQSKTFIQISNVTYVRAAARKPGRPFGLSIGKQKSRS